MNNPTARLFLHLIALYGGGTIAFDFVPAHYRLLVGAVWAGIVAFAAFVDQSISKAKD